MILCRLFPSVCVAGHQQRVQDVVWFENNQGHRKEEQEQEKGQVQDQEQNQEQEQEQEQDLDYIENMARQLSSLVWMDSGEP